MQQGMKRRLLFAGLAAAVVATAATAEVKLPRTKAPIPLVKPTAYEPTEPAAPAAYAPTDNPVIRAKEDPFEKALKPAPLVAASDVTRLREGLDALAKGDIAGAARVRDQLKPVALDHHILAWAIAINGGDVASGELAEALTELSGWPGLATVRRNLERSLYREQAGSAEVVKLLGDAAPKTFEGTVALTRAQLALGKKDAARATIAPFWRKARLEAAEESRILADFGDLLSQADHRARMEQMLHFERVGSADRIAARAGAEELAKAWTAVIRKEKNAAKLLDTVPKAQRGAGYIFAKARQLRWAGKDAEAAALMLTAPTDAAELVDPDAWWTERRVLSRELLDLGDEKTAYRLAAAHAAESPAAAADAEFHAGWYALRALRDPKLAATHFQRITQIAEGPISQARGYYWMGRAAAEGGPGVAKDLFAAAAKFGTTFYGQLAANKLGQPALAASAPEPTASDRQAFSARIAVQAIDRLEAAGDHTRAALLYRDLATELSSPGELSLLVARAQTRDDHYLALKIAKLAAGRGLDVGGLTHPVGAIPTDARISGAGKALAYAIARQESEFNTNAVSPAGARGLLQLMPGTARQMAKTAGLAYAPQKLTSDAGYNATLGSAYLDDQLARFDGSYVLTFAGYNAGPSRAAEWVKRYGDPRGKDIDAVVDWIERIPFTETRNYVQRVMENYQVYKMRLAGRYDIAADLTTGR